MNRRRDVMIAGAWALALGPGAALAADFNWKQAAGANLVVALPAHPLSSALVKYLPEFTAKTGINVKPVVSPENAFRVKLNSDLAAGTGTIDVFLTGPSSNWEYAAGKWIENLQPYVDDKSKTSAAWDFADFYPGAVDVNRWTGKQFGGVGQGPLYAIPMNEEGYSLTYRKDVLAKAGVAVPQTIDELIAAAKKLHGFEMDGRKLDGFVARGQALWPTLITGYSAFLFAYGGTDILPNGKSGVASAGTIAATGKWAEIMKFAPRDVSSYGWEQAQNSFAAGNAVFLLDADHMSAVFEDKTKSQVAGKVGYALPPAGPNGRASGIWLWSLGMNSASKQKTAAWLFIQWASSKDNMERAVPFGSINPTRKSVAASKTMTDYVAGWDNYGKVWQENLANHARWRWNPSTSFAQMGDRWMAAVQEVMLTGATPEAALKNAEGEINQIIDDARGGK